VSDEAGVAAVALTEERWSALRASVRDTTQRFSDLVVGARDVTARATTSWSVAQIAAHVTIVSLLHNITLRPDHPGLPVPDLADRVAATTVDTVAQLNELALAHYPERDPWVVTGQLRAEVDQMLAASDGLDPTTVLPWLGGANISVAGIFAHMLNELSLHGWDVARATGARWEIPPADAAPFFEVFVVGLVRSGYGRLLDGDVPSTPDRVAVRFRSKLTEPVTIVLRDGRVTLAREPGPADVVVSYHPTWFNLMMFGRVSRLRALATGRVVVRGRRPWLLPRFLAVVRMPA
jgi:hypothetical protein